MSDQLMWFKSSYSGGEGGACVEVATRPTTIHVRDSKLRHVPAPGAPQLAVPAAAWVAFLTYACAENAENGES
ncbi:DUF397 domain-containing protein [Streptomyces sp. NBC_01429]|uniref:DUF397 domain-containing protein n=1 Tax=Streptomyces sp. NBC_01429 TaxID=2903862 RepID=UPI002E2DD249|nr:DUF397 domain-containing protein [Streptomyces sp. NBC_01429]